MLTIFIVSPAPTAIMAGLTDGTIASTDGTMKVIAGSTVINVRTSDGSVVCHCISGESLVVSAHPGQRRLSSAVNSFATISSVRKVEQLIMPHVHQAPTVLASIPCSMMAAAPWLTM